MSTEAYRARVQRKTGQTPRYWQARAKAALAGVPNAHVASEGTAIWTNPLTNEVSVMVFVTFPYARS